MDYRNIEKRLHSAQQILQAQSVDKTTFESLQTLLKGINPRLDMVLANTTKAYKNLQQFQSGDLTELVIVAVPEVTPEQKKRKKALLLFLNFWKELQNEVSRIEKEMKQQVDNTPASHLNTFGKIFSGAKGPLGLITVIATGIVLLKLSEVSVIVKNNGCEPMTPISSMAINIPGIQLPNSTIPTGGTAVVKLPPLKLTVDATMPNLVRLNTYGVKYDFTLDSPNITLIFDDQILNGQTKVISLGSQKQHSLIIECGLNEK